MGYGLTYEGIVAALPPYRGLLDEIVGYIRRSVPDRSDPRTVEVLDVSCGIGTLAFRVAQAGYAVTGIEGVEYLVDVAREKRRARNIPNVSFHCLTIGRDELPWQDRFSFAVSLHTLYWHPAPLRVVEGMARVLRPGGHGLVVNLRRPVRLVSMVREIWRTEGVGAAVQALRWLVPTVVFEGLREYEPHYTDGPALGEMLAGAGLEVVENKATFLTGISALVLVRRPS